MKLLASQAAVRELLLLLFIILKQIINEMHRKLKEENIN